MAHEFRHVQSAVEHGVRIAAVLCQRVRREAGAEHGRRAGERGGADVAQQRAPIGEKGHGHRSWIVDRVAPGRRGRPR